MINCRSALSASYSFAINEKGELYGWGSNAQGRLGDGTTIDPHR